MKTLERHEQFEMLVLDEMRKIKVLDQLVFGGGTMLRLCFDLPRCSVDLDFYLRKERKDFLSWAEKLTEGLNQMGADITDNQEKHYSFLWEFRMSPYPRRLKIEVRKDTQQARSTELSIAHSSFSPLQVRLRTLTLEQMWSNKVCALSERNELRDAYDLEFLVRRGMGKFEELPKELLGKLTSVLNSFSEQDFKVKLGSILDRKELAVVLSNRFSYLRSKIAAAL